MAVVAVHPVLRMFDYNATVAFYVDFAGFNLDWEEGEPDGPRYLQVSTGSMKLHLSTHHDDGTPGSVVVIEVDDLLDFHRRLHERGYRFMNPGLEPGPGENMASTELIDPASNRLRFFQRGLSLDSSKGDS